ncbi:SigE family RNA polymerase sigma factor [Kribbella albertanoniae]|uniref:Sigma-70 family RNA polymerase sigma factor n=2 Tax=Kribbella albertanoniae TaxID=1266829 RepID=A0A4R4Q7F0_9ACTN|nr:sigma-70 family RNA polymerase sigma factor [Kribbella albertanoniae]
MSTSGPHEALLRDEARTVVSALHMQHWTGLVRLAVLTMGDRQAAEDVVQEAFATLYRQWPLKEEGVELGYLRAAVLYRSRSVLRRRRVARMYTPPYQAPKASAESDVVLSEERGEVQRALQGLPARTREVLVLRFYLDLPFGEIAALLGIREASARSTASRRLVMLTNRLKGLR